MGTQLVGAAADVEAEGDADGGAGGEAPRCLRAVGVAAVVLLQVPGGEAVWVPPAPPAHVHGCCPPPPSPGTSPPHSYLHGYFSGTKWCRWGVWASQRWQGIPDTVMFTWPR